MGISGRAGAGLAVAAEVRRTGVSGARVTSALCRAELRHGDVGATDQQDGDQSEGEGDFKDDLHVHGRTSFLGMESACCAEIYSDIFLSETR